MVREIQAGYTSIRDSRILKKRRCASILIEALPVVVVGAGVLFTPMDKMIELPQNIIELQRWYIEHELTPYVENPKKIEVKPKKTDTKPKKIEVEIGTYEIPDYPGMKKWMSYKSFSSGTAQKKLQNISSTDGNGLRVTADGRYCVAMGTHFEMNIGQRFDLILQNGHTIPCVLADVKAPQDTDASNIFSNKNKNLCASEFVVAPNKLHKEAKKRGDVSVIHSKWNSPVKYVKVYKSNVLKE